MSASELAYERCVASTRRGFGVRITMFVWTIT